MLCRYSKREKFESRQTRLRREFDTEFEIWFGSNPVWKAEKTTVSSLFTGLLVYVSYLTSQFSSFCLSPAYDSWNDMEPTTDLEGRLMQLYHWIK